MDMRVRWKLVGKKKGVGGNRGRNVGNRHSMWWQWIFHKCDSHLYFNENLSLTQKEKNNVVRSDNSIG